MNKIELLRHDDAGYVLMYGTDVDLISEYVVEMIDHREYENWLSYEFSDSDRDLFDAALDAVKREYPAKQYEFN